MIYRAVGVFHLHAMCGEGTGQVSELNTGTTPKVSSISSFTRVDRLI